VRELREVCGGSCRGGEAGDSSVCPAVDPLERKVFAVEVVKRFYDSIAAQRKRGVGWETIAQLLRLSGHRVTTKAVNKYFLKEYDRRCADASKTKIKAAA